jgi:hypothetical protein
MHGETAAVVQEMVASGWHARRALFHRERFDELLARAASGAPNAPFYVDQRYPHGDVPAVPRTERS